MKEQNNIKSVLKLIEASDGKKAIEILRLIASPQAHLIDQIQYANLARKIMSEPIELPVIKIAFLANVTLEHWVSSLETWLLLEGFKLEPYIVPIGTWSQEILDPNSSLYSFKADIVWFFLHESELKFDKGVLNEKNSAEKIVSHAIQNITQKISLFAKNSPCITIVNNIVPSVERIFGNYEGCINTSPAALIQRFNSQLVEALTKTSIIFDMAHIASSMGLNNWHDERLWQYSKHPFSFNSQAQVAFSAARLLSAIKGGAKKCLVLDLDNTLWGGVIGDDGIDGIKVGSNNGTIGESYAIFQRWIKALANRGIVLAVCSKNNLILAQEPFNKKDGMILKISDFTAFYANWENKVDNIKKIAMEVNIGLDAIVFVDDNPAERELIRSMLPQVAVPELPLDPSGYIRAIDSGKWFETIGITEEDSLRVYSYGQNQVREKVRNASTDLTSYLKNLEMTAKWQEVDGSTLARATQLINKTNQFNMTTTRYTEAQITKFIESNHHWVGCFSLSDFFGDLGIISVVVLENNNKKTIIDTWVMSCRVFSRGVEDFIFEKLYYIVKKQSQEKLIGKYIATPKNKIIANLYGRFGGVSIKTILKEELQWQFNLSKPIQTNEIYIKELGKLT